MDVASSGSFDGSLLSPVGSALGLSGSGCDCVYVLASGGNCQGRHGWTMSHCAHRSQQTLVFQVATILFRHIFLGGYNAITESMLVYGGTGCVCPLPPRAQMLRGRRCLVKRPAVCCAW